MKILIVDDLRSSRHVIAKMLLAEGYECIEAENGQHALDVYTEESPDLVLMDIKMPVMDGYEAAKLLKSNVKNAYLPIIFLTAETNPDGLLKCLECGGDDFLQKPVNIDLLRSKIAAHQRTVLLTREVHAKSEEIQGYHDTLTREHEMGNHVLSHALSLNLRHSENIRSHLVPQSKFNGDILLSAAKPYGGLYVFLGDLTGHGLSAAIGTIPLSQVFFTMTNKGKTAAAIIRELNRSLRAFLPRSMFCAGILLELSADGKSAKVWSGGVPLCLHLKASEGSAEVVPSTHLPLGVLDPDSFDATMAELRMSEGDSLMMMTDGVLDAQNITGDMFGNERVQSIVEQDVENAFDRLLDRFYDFVGEAPQVDDVSLVQVLARPSEAVRLEQQDSLPWSTQIHLDAATLRENQSVVDDMLHLLPERLEFAVYHEKIATVVTELFSNALEHGLLGLVSDYKSDAEGFAKYYALREERLNTLSSGSIDVRFLFDVKRIPHALEVRVTDTGEGFQHSQNLVDPDNLEKSFGRGIALVQSLCSIVEYSDKGNDVRALINLE